MSFDRIGQSVQSLSCVWLFATPWTTACQASLSITNSRKLSRWCHPTIFSSVVPFSSRLQSFPASGSFQMSQRFTSGGQSVRASASTQFPLWDFKKGIFKKGMKCICISLGNVTILGGKRNTSCRTIY